MSENVDLANALGAQAKKPVSTENKAPESVAAIPTSANSAIKASEKKIKKLEETVKDLEDKIQSQQKKTEKLVLDNMEEIKKLSEENGSLKEENQSLKDQIEDYKKSPGDAEDVPEVDLITAFDNLIKRVRDDRAKGLVEGVKEEIEGKLIAAKQISKTA